jgi:hypothetical protein
LGVRQHPSRCICYQLITICQLVNKKIKMKVVKNMGLLMWHMKLYVFHNGGKNILNYIVGCNLFLTMGATKVGPCKI